MMIMHFTIVDENDERTVKHRSVVKGKKERKCRDISSFSFYLSSRSSY